MKLTVSQTEPPFPYPERGGLDPEGISLRPSNGGSPVREFGIAQLEDGPVGDGRFSTWLFVTLLAGVVGKRPDFVWVGEDCGILIEAKFSLLPNVDRALCNASAAVNVWERAHDALEQATEFAAKNHRLLSEHWPGVKQWLVAVVVHDAFPEQTTRFKAVAKRAGLKSERFAALALLSTGELESWVRASSAEGQLPSHLRSAWARILPGKRFDIVDGR